MRKIHHLLFAAGIECEKLPASEQQTATAVAIENVMGAVIEAEELLERAANLVGNPGTNISFSTDSACDEWQKDYLSYLNNVMK